MLYHLIVAVFGMALLVWGWACVQRRSDRERCDGLTDGAACAVGPGCHGCARAAVVTEREEKGRARDSLFPGERAWPEEASQERRDCDKKQELGHWLRAAPNL